jgi:hypothetical protein
MNGLYGRKSTLPSLHKEAETSDPSIARLTRISLTFSTMSKDKRNTV